MPSIADRYASPWYLAAYLEAEWADFLWSGSDSGKSTGRAEFYKSIPKLVVGSLGDERPTRYCDIGGSTGRTTYEMFREIPSLAEFVLVEPSAQFCSWAKRLLLGGEDYLYDWAPTIYDLHKPVFKKVQAFPAPLEITEQKKIYIYQAQSDSVPRPNEYFDVMTCLNVVDRVPNPKIFAKDVGDLLKPGGTLVFASPLEYEEETTPDQGLWVRDLKELFPQPVWKIEKEEDAQYHAVPYRRKHIIYSTQILVLRKQKQGL
ncbi:MAG: methyltransferase domain-containing protein [Thermoanaerobaculia bacterium]